jgi:hypothetical protein
MHSKKFNISRSSLDRSMGRYDANTMVTRIHVIAGQLRT